MKNIPHSEALILDKQTGLPVTIKENLWNGLFVVEFLVTATQKKKKELTDTLLGQLALRQWYELQQDDNAIDSFAKQKEIHKAFVKGLRSLAAILDEARIGTNPSTFSGRSATTSDLDGTKLYKAYKAIAGDNRYNGLVKDTSLIDKEAVAAYKKYYELADEEDPFIHFNQQAAANFVQLVQDLPDLAATRFLHAVYDLHANGWIWENAPHSDQSIGGDDMFAIWAILFADIMSRNMNMRDDTDIIRWDFLSKLWRPWSENYISANKLWIGNAREKSVWDMIIWEEGYTTPWSLDRMVTPKLSLNRDWVGTSTVRLKKVSAHELMVIGVAEDGRSGWMRGNGPNVTVWQKIAITQK